MARKSARVLNIGLRFGTLGIRFLFVFFLAKYLDAASVGYYGLFTASVGYALYFIGLDYYVYVTREIIRTPNDHRGQLLKGQAALSGVLFIVFLPFALVFLGQVGWPAHLVWWFLPILVLEYFNQEVYRLLVALSEQIAASLLLFVRQGTWAIAIIALMNFNAESRNLDTAMALWTTAGIAAATLGIWKLKGLQMGGWRQPVNWKWVRKGVTISIAFLVATLALRGMQTIDRFWLQALTDIETVGAYVLFMGMASSLLVFLDAGVFSFTYPALIKHNHSNERPQARKKVKIMLYQTVAISFSFSIVSWGLLPYLLDWVGNPVYHKAISLFPWVLALTIVNAISMVPHYALYACGHDRPIIWSHIMALPVFAIATLAASQFSLFLAVPVGLATSFLLILIWKTLAYLQVIRNQDPVNHLPPRAQKY